MGTVWYTSDLHLGHLRVAGLRGFDSTQAHDTAVLGSWERVVRDVDTVWVLGDLTVDERNLDYALASVAGLPGTKHLIAGNHDSCHPMHRSAHRHQRRYLAAFDSVQAFATRRFYGRSFLLSHFPAVGDHTAGERYGVYRLRDAGLPIVHGHTHLPGRVTHTQSGTRQVHVGLDAWGLMPVPEHVVADLVFGDVAP